MFIHCPVACNLNRNTLAAGWFLDFLSLWLITSPLCMPILAPYFPMIPVTCPWSISVLLSRHIILFFTDMPSRTYFFTDILLHGNDSAWDSSHPSYAPMLIIGIDLGTDTTMCHSWGSISNFHGYLYCYPAPSINSSPSLPTYLPEVSSHWYKNPLALSWSSLQPR